MKNWAKIIFVVLLIVVGSFMAIGFAMRLDVDMTRSQTRAGWVQAVGSILAILLAFWIAGEQRRNEEKRLKDDARTTSYLVQAELAWLSTEITGFLNQFIYAESGSNYAFVIGDDDIADFLQRLSWCRQRVEHKGQLAMIGTLRESLMKTVRVIRMREKHPPMRFEYKEIKAFNDHRREALEVMNFANGMTQNKRYMP